MPPENRDMSSLWDMLTAAKDVCDFTPGVRYDQYLKDRKLQLAVERSIEIIGEAARRVSQPFRETHPEIPWQSIIALRNVLAHEYAEVKQEAIWLVITENIPDLIQTLEALLTRFPPEKEP